MAKSRKLVLEVLEDRLAPATWGISWPNPGHMSLSFVPDGTGVDNGQSSLFQALNGTMSTSAWQLEILRAFQSWAVNADINIGVISDGGQALGASGAVQGDSRFGDVRLARAPQLSADEVATASPFDLSGTTWGGDVVLGTLYNFGIGDVVGQYDLFTVLAHESGHVFGLDHNSTDANSVMTAGYSYKTGLSASDIANLQAIYGARSAEAVDNGSFSSALNLLYPDEAPVTGDIGTLTDVDFYSFTTPASGGTSFTVHIQAAGLSLLVSSVTVFDAAHNVVGFGAASSALSNDVTVQIDNAQPGAVYYVQVAGATGSVFGIGSYELLTQFPNSTTPGDPSGGTAGGSNHSFDTAQLLTEIEMTSNSQGFTYDAAGTVALNQGSFYRVTAPTLPVAGAEMLTVTAASTDANGLRPYITVFDVTHNPLTSTVINNGDGTYTVQLAGVAAGADYYVEVSALDGAAQNVGSFSLAAQFNNAEATTFSHLASATLSAATFVGYKSLTVEQSQLVQFSLSADIGAPTVNSAVRMTIYDEFNNEVTTMVAYAGQPLSTDFVFLSAGTYTVRFNAATQTGELLPDLAWTLEARRINDPIGPVPIDPTQSPTGGTGITINESTGGTATLLPIIDPYSNPVDATRI